MTVRVGINGFGRIGRQSLRTIIERAPGKNGKAAPAVKPAAGVRPVAPGPATQPAAAGAPASKPAAQPAAAATAAPKP